MWKLKQIRDKLQVTCVEILGRGLQYVWDVWRLYLYVSQELLLWLFVFA